MRSSFFGKKNQGFTLIEAMVALALTSFFVVNAMSLLGDINKLVAQTKETVSEETDLSLAVAMVGKAIHNVGPSFNLVTGNLDDNNREFFDFFPDMPMSGAAATRTLTLSAAANRFNIVFAVQNLKQVEVVHYDPMSAYLAPTAIDTTMASSLALTYKGVDQGGIMSSNYPKFWVPNQYILMRVPIPLRYVSVAGTVNMATPPRELSYVGRVVAAPLGLAALASDPFLAGRVYTTHPATLVSIPNADKFFRSIPTAGGASPLVLVEAIDFVKFELVLNSATGRYDLHSSKYVGGTYVSDILVSPDIKELVFKRDSVSRPIVSVQITKY